MLWSRMKYDIVDFFKKKGGVRTFWGNATGGANTELSAEMIKNQKWVDEPFSVCVESIYRMSAHFGTRNQSVMASD